MRINKKKAFAETIVSNQYGHERNKLSSPLLTLQSLCLTLFSSYTTAMRGRVTPHCKCVSVCV